MNHSESICCADNTIYPPVTKRYVFVKWCNCEPSKHTVVRGDVNYRPAQTNSRSVGVKGLLGTVKNIYADPDTDKTASTEMWLSDEHTQLKVASVHIVGAKDGHASAEIQHALSVAQSILETTPDARIETSVKDPNTNETVASILVNAPPLPSQGLSADFVQGDPCPTPSRLRRNS